MDIWSIFTLLSSLNNYGVQVSRNYLNKLESAMLGLVAILLLSPMLGKHTGTKEEIQECLVLRIYLFSFPINLGDQNAFRFSDTLPHHYYHRDIQNQGVKIFMCFVFYFVFLYLLHFLSVYRIALWEHSSLTIGSTRISPV